MHLEMRGVNLRGLFHFGYGPCQAGDPARPLSSPPCIPFLHLGKFILSSVLKFQVSDLIISSFSASALSPSISIIDKSGRINLETQLSQPPDWGTAQRGQDDRLGSSAEAFVPVRTSNLDFPTSDRKQQNHSSRRIALEKLWSFKR
jgi:hypothetical protein